MRVRVGLAAKPSRRMARSACQNAGDSGDKYPSRKSGPERRQAGPLDIHVTLSADQACDSQVATMDSDLWV